MRRESPGVGQEIRKGTADEGRGWEGKGGEKGELKTARFCKHPFGMRVWGSGNPIFFPRYSTITREGSMGSSFYLLLEGKVRISSTVRGFNILYQRGASFGEAALLHSLCQVSSIK